MGYYDEMFYYCYGCDVAYKDVYRNKNGDIVKVLGCEKDERKFIEDHKDEYEFIKRIGCACGYDVVLED